MGLFKIGKMVMRSLGGKPATKMYPVVPQKMMPLTRGHVAIDEKNCILCGICAKRCPAQAIEVSKEAKTWVINRMRCVMCNSCTDACPKKCLSMEGEYTAPSATITVHTVEVPVQEKPKLTPEQIEAMKAAAAAKKAAAAAASAGEAPAEPAPADN